MNKTIHTFIPTALLCEIGEALYGPNWITPLARALRVDVRRMQRASIGEEMLRQRVLHELLDLVDQKETRLAFLRGKIIAAQKT